MAVNGGMPVKAPKKYWMCDFRSVFGMRNIKTVHLLLYSFYISKILRTLRKYRKYNIKKHVAYNRKSAVEFNVTESL